MQFGRIGGDRDPWLTRRLWLHAAVAAPLIATAVAGAAIAIYVGFGGEAKAEKNVPLSGVGVLAGAVYAAAIARRLNGSAGWPLRAALVAVIVVVAAWLISLTLVRLRLCDDGVCWMGLRPGMSSERACDPQLRQDPGMSVYDSKGGFQRWAS